jgi:ribonucleoside-triphosphate reductase
MAELDDAWKSTGLKVKTSRLTIEDFNRDRIKHALINEAGIGAQLAGRIAREAEERLIKFNVQNLTAPLIRELVNAILLERGMEKEQQSLARVGLPVFDVQQLLSGSSSQYFSSPEMVQHVIGDSVLQEYLMRKSLPNKVADAHLRGDIHVDHASYWLTRPWTLQHDPRLFFTHGLHLTQARPSISPPETLLDALLLIAKIFQWGQTNIAGEQGIDHFNVFLSPFLDKRESTKQIRKSMRIFLEELNLVPAGRGGTPPSITLTLDIGIPEILHNQTAIGPKGQDVGVYASYEKNANILVSSLIDVLLSGDSQKRPFIFPTLVVRLNRKTFSDKNKDLLLNIFKATRSFSNVIFINHTPEWQGESAVYTGNRERLTATPKGGWELGTLRTGVLDSVTINLPRLAYDANRNEGRFSTRLMEQLETAATALESKRKLFEKQLRTKNYPFLTMKFKGESYYRLAQSRLVISYVGLPEAVSALTSSALTTETGLKHGIKLVTQIDTFCKTLNRETEHIWVSGPVSNPTAAYRLAEADREHYSQQTQKPLGIQIPKGYSIGNTQNIDTFDIELDLHSKLQKLQPAGHYFPITPDIDNPPEHEFHIAKNICEQYEIGFFGFWNAYMFCNVCNQKWKGIHYICPNCRASAENLNQIVRLPARFTPLNMLDIPQREVWKQQSLNG